MRRVEFCFLLGNVKLKDGHGEIPVAPGRTRTTFEMGVLPEERDEEEL